MGNSASQNQKHPKLRNTANTNNPPLRTTTSNSNTTSNTTLGSLGRKRKSLELPDLDPLHSRLTDLPSHHSISNSTNPLSLTSLTTTLNQFQLRLPPRSRSSSINTSRPSSPLVTQPTITNNNNSIPASVLDHLKFDSTHHPSASVSSAPINLLHNPPPNQAHPDFRIPISTHHSQPSDPDSPSHRSSTIPPTTSHVDSPIISAAPLQQPIETVLPPLPPSIVQPFPLPSLDADSAQLPSVPLNSSVTETVKAATAVVQASPALDIGAGPAGVPTLITWKEPANEVFVTGTFSKWKQQIKLRKPDLLDQPNQQNAFSALVALPPGPHQLKFIVDRRWKTSKYLPSATDDKGNLINYLQVNPGDQPFRGLGPRGIWSGYTYGIGYSIGSILEDSNQSDYLNQDDSNHNSDSEEEWTTEIPNGLLEYEEYHDRSDDEEAEVPSTSTMTSGEQQTDQPVPGQAGFAAEPPKLPAQLKEGILNLSSRSPQLASDDNSLLPRPDHSVLNHLAASPIRHGLLSVGVTSRFKRKYLTTVYYKPVDL